MAEKTEGEGVTRAPETGREPLPELELELGPDLRPRLRKEVVFSMAPTDLTTDPLLSNSARVVGAILTAMAGADRYCCWPTNRAVAARLGCRCTKTVTRALRQLTEAGWISVEPCPQVAAGRLIRLLWRRREPVYGRKTPGTKLSRGGDKKVPPPRTKESPLIRSKGEETKSEAPAPRGGGGLSPEELAELEARAKGPDGPRRRWAELTLRRWRDEEVNKKTPAGGGSLAGRPPTGGGANSSADAPNLTKETAQTSRPENRIEHKNRYQTLPWGPNRLAPRRTGSLRSSPCE